MIILCNIKNKNMGFPLIFLFCILLCKFVSGADPIAPNVSTEDPVVSNPVNSGDEENSNAFYDSLSGKLKDIYDEVQSRSNDINLDSVKLKESYEKAIETLKEYPEKLRENPNFPYPAAEAKIIKMYEDMKLKTQQIEEKISTLNIEQIDEKINQMKEEMLIELKERYNNISRADLISIESKIIDLKEDIKSKLENSSFDINLIQEKINSIKEDIILKYQNQIGRGVSLQPQSDQVENTPVDGLSNNEPIDDSSEPVTEKEILIEEYKKIVQELQNKIALSDNMEQVIAARDEAKEKFNEIYKNISDSIKGKSYNFLQTDLKFREKSEQQLYDAYNVLYEKINETGTSFYNKFASLPSTQKFDENLEKFYDRVPQTMQQFNEKIPARETFENNWTKIYDQMNVANDKFKEKIPMTEQMESGWNNLYDKMRSSSETFKEKIPTSDYVEEKFNSSYDKFKNAATHQNVSQQLSNTYEKLKLFKNENSTSGENDSINNDETADSAESNLNINNETGTLTSQSINEYKNNTTRLKFNSLNDSSIDLDELGSESKSRISRLFGKRNLSPNDRRLQLSLNSSLLDSIDLFDSANQIKQSLSSNINNITSKVTRNSNENDEKSFMEKIKDNSILSNYSNALENVLDDISFSGNNQSGSLNPNISLFSNKNDVKKENLFNRRLLYVPSQESLNNNQNGCETCNSEHDQFRITSIGENENQSVISQEKNSERRNLIENILEALQLFNNDAPSNEETEKRKKLIKMLKKNVLQDNDDSSESNNEIDNNNSFDNSERKLKIGDYRSDMQNSTVNKIILDMENEEPLSIDEKEKIKSVLYKKFSKKRFYSKDNKNSLLNNLFLNNSNNNNRYDKNLPNRKSNNIVDSILTSIEKKSEKAKSDVLTFKERQQNKNN